MKCNRKHWIKGLDLMKHVIEPRSTIVALCDAVVSAADGFVRISATSLDVEVEVSIPATGEMSARVLEWKTLVQMSKAAKRVRGEQITVVATDSGVRLSMGGRTFEIDSNGSMADRPRELAGVGLAALESFDAARLLRALEYTSKSASRDASRVALCGLHMDGDGSILATNGHTLHKAMAVGGFTIRNAPMPVTFASWGLLIDAIKATGAEYVMGRHFAGGRNLLEFSLVADEISVLIREYPIEQKFPPTDQIIPTHGKSMIVDREKLLDSMTTATRVLKNSLANVKLVANGALTVYADAYREVLPLVRSAPEEFTFGANAKYVANACTTSGATVEMFFGEALDPVRIDVGDDMMAVVMPCRI